MFFGLPDPHPDPLDTSPSRSSSKNNKKNLGFFCFVTSLCHFSLKNYVNAPGFRIQILMFLGLPDPHPDPLVRGTDLMILILIRIRTKMSWIRNTFFGKNIYSSQKLTL